MSRGYFGEIKRNNWKTPIALYQKLNQEFHFDFDPCPPDSEFDGLSIDWGKSNFVNPPYDGYELPKWIEKSFIESQKEKIVVLLIPSRTDTRWWHKFVMQAQEIRFIKGRLKYGDENGQAPFASVIVIFNSNCHKVKVKGISQ